jgi:hypothetical protein
MGAMCGIGDTEQKTFGEEMKILNLVKKYS